MHRAARLTDDSSFSPQLPLSTNPAMARGVCAPEPADGGEVVEGDGKEAVVVGHVDAIPPEKELDHRFKLRNRTRITECGCGLIAWLRKDGLLQVAAEGWEAANFGYYQEEAVDNNVEVESGERAAWVIVVPQADLHWYNNGGVEQQRRAAKEHSW
jgi:hypothetical protein